ncbi:unnamed protein product [Ceutorhynchus assimilis]|uniref:Copper transport protein n=1 Tax=Ceutorhynchus assimilis TaxID=467358 RepID=A0A9P0DKC1_9CUCU|nr:unnamed protein product [Ceutorhynchus assimilis]
MEMYFEFSKRSTVLFRQWAFNSYGGLAGSMVGLFAMAFGFEAIRFYRAHLLKEALIIRKRNVASGSGESAQLTIMSKAHLVQTLFHGIQAIFSYMLMLVFMTYNGGLCIAVVLGLVCGYFVFGWKVPNGNILTEDCCA